MDQSARIPAAPSDLLPPQLPPLSPPNPPQTLKKPSHKGLIIVIVIALLMVIGLSLGLIFLPSKKTVTAPKASSLPTKTTQPNKALAVPVDPNNSAVKSAQVVYVLTTNLKTVTSASDSATLKPITILETDVNLKGLPPTFTVTENTKIFSKTNDKKTKATATDLKPNQKVEITAKYGLKSKKWTTDEVSILNN